MEVIGVRAVIFWAQHSAKPPAGALVHDAQEFAFRRGSAIPIIDQRDPAAIGKDEARDVDRCSAGMR